MNSPRENAATTREQPLVRFGLRLANWSECWFPDPLVFALLGIVVAFVVGVLLHQSPAKLAIQGGKDFWCLVPFTMQMVMIIIGGYVVASTPIVYCAIRALAGIPKTPRRAVATIAHFSMLTFADLLGLEPDLQRTLRPRTRSSRERNGLPRCRRRPLLDASSAGHTEVEGQGHRRIWSPSVGRPRTGRVFRCWMFARYIPYVPRIKWNCTHSTTFGRS
jgi:hypothetical protein